MPDLFAEFVQKLVLLFHIKLTIGYLVVDDIGSQLLGELRGKIVVLRQLFRIGDPPVEQLLALVDLREVPPDLVDDVAHVDDADHLDQQHRQDLPGVLGSDVPVADREHRRAGEVEGEDVPVGPGVVKCGDPQGPVGAPVVLRGHVQDDALNGKKLYKNVDEDEAAPDELSDLNLIPPVGRDLNLQQNIKLLESSVYFYNKDEIDGN